MRVDTVMSKTVVTIRSNASIAEAIAKLVEHKISGLPVLNEMGRLVGMVTEGDLLRRIELGTQHQRPNWLGFLRRHEKAADDYVHDHSRRVSDIMTRDPVTVDEATALDAVVALMEEKGIRRVPVVANGGLVGIVSRSDLIRVLGQILQAQIKKAATVRRPDPAIQADVLAEWQKQAWFRACKVSLDVQEGRVHIKGTVADETIEAALRAAAEGISGVTTVKMAVSRGHAKPS